MSEKKKLEIVSGSGAREKILSGVKVVSDTVGATMGPGGRLVMSDGPGTPWPSVTKDGVSVAKMVQLEDLAEDQAAQFVIQAALRQVEDSGDGTTLTSVLCDAFLSRAIQMIQSGINPVQLKREMESAVQSVIGHLELVKIDVADESDLIDIALIASNGDRKISDMIARTVWKTGKYGYITQEYGNTTEHRVDYFDGYRLETGLQSKAYPNQPNHLMSYQNPFVLVTNHEVYQAVHLMPIMRDVCERWMAEDRQGKPTLILVCPSISPEIMQVSQRNITEEDGEFNLIWVKPSKSLDSGTNEFILEDIAAITGGIFIRQDSGIHIKSVNMNMLGTIGEINSNPWETLFVGFNQQSRDQRKEYLTELIQKMDDSYKKKQAEESLARITGSVARIRIGGSTDSEQKEILDRVDDAVRACKTALESGYNRGGGVELILACDNIPETIGGKIVKECMEIPARTILTNYQKPNAELILQKIQEKQGYDLFGDNHRDMLELGIIDPNRVLTGAIRHAFSAAMSLIGTEVIITRQ